MRATLPDEGSLDGQSAEALLARLAGERFVGRCQFLGELQGELSLHEGMVTSAQARDETGMLAALRLLGLARGHYRLEAGNVETASSPGGPVGSWPEVAERFRSRSAHLDRLAQPLGGSQQRWTLRQERHACTPSYLAPLATLLQRTRAVHEVVTLAPCGLEECVAGLRVLVSLGVLRVPLDDPEEAVSEGEATPEGPSAPANSEDPRLAAEPVEERADAAVDVDVASEQQPTEPSFDTSGEMAPAPEKVVHDVTENVALPVSGEAEAEAEASDEQTTPRPDGGDVDAIAEVGVTARGAGRPLPPPGGQELTSSTTESTNAEDTDCQRWSSQGAPPPTLIDDFDEPVEMAIDEPLPLIRSTRMNLNLTRSVHRGTRSASPAEPDDSLDEDDLRAIAAVSPAVQRAVAAAGIIMLGAVAGYLLGQL